jgi:uncharacterized OsmC-like protein
MDLFDLNAEDVSRLPDLPDRMAGHVFTNSAHVESLEGMRKVARVRQFEFFCDEPPIIGGADEYPQPLGYLAAAVGFCLLTQVSRLARMTKKQVTRASCDCDFDIRQHGSVLRGDYRSEAVEFRIHLSLDSPESPEAIAELIRLAEQSCFAEDLIRRPVPLVSTFEVNGEPWEPE